MMESMKESLYFLLVLASAVTVYFMLTELAKFLWQWFMSRKR